MSLMRKLVWNIASNNPVMKLHYFPITKIMWLHLSHEPSVMLTRKRLMVVGSISSLAPESPIITQNSASNIPMPTRAAWIALCHFKQSIGEEDLYCCHTIAETI